jgi:hypothetical protein
MGFIMQASCVYVYIKEMELGTRSLYNQKKDTVHVLESLTT